MKKMSAFIIAVFLIFIQVVPMQANDIMPLWDNITRLTCRVTFDETVGTAYCKVGGRVDATRIVGSAVLYENGSEIMSWDINEYDNFWSISYEFTGVPGRSYELTLDVEVYMNGVWEPVEESDVTVC